MRTFTKRAIATAAAAAIALTTFSLQPAAAGYRRGNDAAAIGAFAAVIGTIAAIIAAQQYRDHAVYRSGYGYGPAHGGWAYRHGHWHRHW